MATNVNVFLADLPGVVEYPSPIRAYLQSALTRAATEGPISAEIKVQWTSSVPTLGDWDLLCYIVRDQTDTIVGGVAELGGSGSPPSGLAGWTRYQTGSTGLAGSEAYYDQIKEGGDGFGGRVVLHELMHNMARAGDHAVHASGAGIGAEEITRTSPLTSTDIRFIARHLLRTRRTQWTGGFGAYRDPLRGL